METETQLQQDDFPSASNSSGSDNRNGRAEMYRLLNKLGESPGDMGLIRSYTDLVRKSAQNAPLEDTVHQFGALETYLIERAQYVDESEVDHLVALSEEVASEREALKGTASSDEPDEPTEVEQLARDIRQQGFDHGRLQEEPEDVDVLVDELEEVARFTREVEEDPIQPLEARIQRLRSMSRFDALVEECRRLLSQAKEEDDATAGAYILQLCEGAMRQLIVAKSEVGPERKHTADELLRALRNSSSRIEKESRKEESKAVWDEFFEDARVDLKKSRKVEKSLQASRDNGAPLSHFTDGVCQRQIDRSEALLKELQSISQRLTHEDEKAKATKLAEELSDLLEKAQQDQQRLYNQYAMVRLKSAMKGVRETSGLAHTNEEKLADALIKRLGRVDTTYLTHDVQQSYQEVLGHILSKLKSPKNDKDFSSKGRKLHALKALHEKSKKPISDF